MICCKGALHKYDNDKNSFNLTKNTFITKNNERSLNMADWLTLKFPIPEKWAPSGVCCRHCKVDFLYNSVKYLKMIKIEPYFKAVWPEIKQLSAKNGVPFSSEFHNSYIYLHIIFRSIFWILRPYFLSITFTILK